MGEKIRHPQAAIGCGRLPARMNLAVLATQAAVAMAMPRCSELCRVARLQLEAMTKRIGAHLLTRRSNSWPNLN
jgi:hypothetical protein